MTDTYPTGRHLISGEWVEGGPTFRSVPASGDPITVHSGGKAEVDAAMRAAEAAFETYGWTTPEARALLLDTIADEIEARGDALTAMGSAETGLPEARLTSERGRTTGQLRLFASHIRKGEYLDRRHDPALPDRAPLPRPDLKMVQRPLGPVAIFGASNFPLAFSTAGGDTASALAAGCPVVFKGHPGHPGTAEIVSRAIASAIGKTGMPPGTFGLIQSNTHEAGAALVLHPLTRAVGFTGSLRGGKALFDLTMTREEPIPFYGELGSINPVFVMPAALASRGADIAKAWIVSLTMGVGQFCTNPGILILPTGAEADSFVETARAALGEVPAQTMLTEDGAEGYRAAVAATAGTATTLLRKDCTGREGAPALFEVSGADWLAHPDLAHEMFGPAGIVIRSSSRAQTEEIARNLQGQLATTLQVDPADFEAAKRLVPILERKAGRVLANGFSTGVEVADAMVHGGPYPASTNFGATSVGTLAIRRFLRAVCYQNMPDDLLPDDLRA